MPDVLPPDTRATCPGLEDTQVSPLAPTRRSGPARRKQLLDTIFALVAEMSLLADSREIFESMGANGFYVARLKNHVA